MEVQERVDKLEEAMMRLVYIQQKTEIEIQNLKTEMKIFKDEVRNDTKMLKDEMKVFKDEMKAFKDEMLEFKNEMKAFKDEMLEFKNEMKAFKDEMVEFKEWSKRNIENMNKQWGALANKMGTLVEDIFAPSIEIALKNYFDVLPEIIDVRKYIRRGGESLEIDILALNESEKKAFVVEVKANPDKVEYIEDFVKKLERLREFLPTLKEYRLYPIYAALDMKAKTVEVLTSKGIYAMIVKGDILKIVNFEKLSEKNI